MKHFAFIFLLFFSFTLHAETSRACTQRWCAEGFSIDFEKPLTAEGSYVFNLEVDGRQIICSGSLPFKGCGNETPNFTCNAEGVFVGESGCALPREDHGLIGLSIQNVPKHVSLSITHSESGKSFTHSQFVKENCTYPNGKDCDPKPCCQAMYRMPVDLR